MKLDDQVTRALHNICNDAKRSLLDFIDIEQRLAVQRYRQRVLSREELDRFSVQTEFMKRRVHNDISRVHQQLMAVFEIYRNGGLIPAFGRDEDELAAARVPTQPRVVDGVQGRP
jgi:hypothetical protein